MIPLEDVSFILKQPKVEGTYYKHAIFAPAIASISNGINPDGYTPDWPCTGAGLTIF